MPTARTQKSGFWMNVREIAVLLFIVFLIRTFGFGLYQVPTGSMETTMLTGERFFADKLTPLFSDIQRGEIIAFNSPLFQYSKNKLAWLFQSYVWGPSNWTKRVIGIPGDTVKGTIEDGKPIVYVNGKKLNESYINKYPLIRVWKIDPKEVASRLRRERSERIWDLVCPKSFDPHQPLDDQPFYNSKKDRMIIEGTEPSVVYPGTPIRPSDEAYRPPVGANYWNGSDEFFVKLGKNQYWVMGDNRLGSKDSRFFGPLDAGIAMIHGRIMYRIWSIDSDESWWIWDLIKHPIDFWRRVRWSRFFQRVR